MSIYKDIEVTHTVSTTAEDYANFPKIKYKSDGERPITLMNPGSYRKENEVVSLSINEAKELVSRLALFLESLDDIKGLGDMAASAAAGFDCAPLFYSDEQ